MRTRLTRMLAIATLGAAAPLVAVGTAAAQSAPSGDGDLRSISEGESGRLVAFVGPRAEPSFGAIRKNALGDAAFSIAALIGARHMLQKHLTIAASVFWLCRQPCCSSRCSGPFSPSF